MKNFNKIIFFLLCFGLINSYLNAQTPPNDERVDNPNNPNNPKPAKPAKAPFQPKIDNFLFGSDFDIAFWNSFYFRCAPYVGYLFMDRLTLNAGLTYTYFSTLGRNSSLSYSEHQYGARVFARLRPFTREASPQLSRFYGHAEFENMNKSVANPNYNPANPSSSGLNQPYYRKFVQTAYVGVGYTNNFSKGASFTIDFLVPVWISEGFRAGTSPLSMFSYRVGFFYVFGQPNS